MFNPLLLLTLVTLVPLAAGQISCAPGRTSNGCANIGGFGYFAPAVTGANPVAAACFSVSPPGANYATTADILTSCTGNKGTQILTTYAQALALSNLKYCPGLLAAGATKLILDAQILATESVFKLISTPATVLANPPALPASCVVPVAGGTTLLLVWDPTVTGTTAFSCVTLAAATTTATLNLPLCTSAPVASPNIDVAPTPWSEWGNCASCGVGSARKRVRTCNWPATAAGTGTLITVACSTAGVAATANQITTSPFVADASANGLLTQTQSQTGICTGTAGPLALTPYSDTCNIAIVIGGGSRAIETFVPGIANAVPANILAACYATLATTGLPYLQNPIAWYEPTPTNRLNVCGRSTLTYTFECWTLANPNTAWTQYVFATTFIPQNIPARVTSFIYASKLWIVGDDNPKMIDLATANNGINFWDSAANPPTIPQNNRTDGGGCAVVVGDFVYLFGGSNTNAVRRMYMKFMGDNIHKWEYLTDVTPAGTVNPYCATVPTNRNQIMIEITPVDASSNTALIYDIYQNTFTQVVSTFDISGYPLNELCHADPSPLYAFPYGTGARSYLSTGTGNGVWPAVTSTGALTNLRNNPAVVSVPKAFFANSFPGLGTCVGC